MIEKFNKHVSILGTAIAMSFSAASASADPIDEMLKGVKAYGDLRLRYEDVEIDNGTLSESVDALTLKTTIGIKTGAYKGFSAQVEFEDVRPALGINEDIDAGSTLVNANTIPDPSAASTELDQAFLQYKNDMVTTKLGRQVITLDGHRHIGHVAWRQDKQTFDAGRVIVKPIKDLTVDVSYLWKVNRINSPAFRDISDEGETSHLLINAAYKTPFGKAVVYHYGLSEEFSGPTWDETDTTGISFTGKTKVSDDLTVLYAAEFAQQDNKTADVEPGYSFIELGASFAGVTVKGAIETLESDTNGGSTENFQTPLATVHKFQGWADVFLGGSLFGTIDGGNGVEDTFFTVAGKVSGVKLVAVYHDYESDEGSTDLGDELNLLATGKFGKRYYWGLKYADYSKGDVFNDTTKTWAWVGMKI